MSGSQQEVNKYLVNAFNYFRQGNEIKAVVLILSEIIRGEFTEGWDWN